MGDTSSSGCVSGCLPTFPVFHLSHLIPLEKDSNSSTPVEPLEMVNKANNRASGATAAGAGGIGATSTAIQVFHSCGTSGETSQRHEPNLWTQKDGSRKTSRPQVARPPLLLLEPQLPERVALGRPFIVSIVTQVFRSYGSSGDGSQKQEEASGNKTVSCTKHPGLRWHISRCCWSQCSSCNLPFCQLCSRSLAAVEPLDIAPMSADSATTESTRACIVTTFLWLKRRKVQRTSREGQK